jgi:hypothetical protein
VESGILRSMPEESTTPDLVERMRARFGVVPDVARAAAKAHAESRG